MSDIYLPQGEAARYLAGCLDAALDAADTIEPRNSLERMLAHQLATAHTAALRLIERANQWLGRSEPFAPRGGHETAVASTEAARLMNAAARMMATFQEGMLTLARVRSGGRQVVTVQHVQVNEGGQAVVAGNISNRGGKRGRGRTPK